MYATGCSKSGDIEKQGAGDMGRIEVDRLPKRAERNKEVGENANTTTTIWEDCMKRDLRKVEE